MGDETQLDSSEQLIRFGVSMPGGLVKALDSWKDSRGYASRSEALRDLLREKLVTNSWDDADGDMESVGVVTLVYNHHTRDLGDNLTEMQHHHHQVALAALHIHLSADNCLEVIVLRGTQAEVKHLADHLISAKGVLHGQFVPTTTGSDVS